MNGRRISSVEPNGGVARVKLSGAEQDCEGGTVRKVEFDRISRPIEAEKRDQLIHRMDRSAVGGGDHLAGVDAGICCCRTWGYFFDGNTKRGDASVVDRSSRICCGISVRYVQMMP